MQAALECDQAAAAVTTGASTPRQRAAAAAAQADALALLSQLHMERREYDKANNYILELLQVTGPAVY